MRSLKICCSLFLFFQGFSADCSNPEALQGTYSISDNGSGVRFVGDNFWFSFHPDLNNFVKPLLVKVDFQDNHLIFRSVSDTEVARVTVKKMTSDSFTLELPSKQIGSSRFISESDFKSYFSKSKSRIKEPDEFSEKELVLIYELLKNDRLTDAMEWIWYDKVPMDIEMGMSSDFTSYEGRQKTLIEQVLNYTSTATITGTLSTYWVESSQCEAKKISEGLEEKTISVRDFDESDFKFEIQANCKNENHCSHTDATLIWGDSHRKGKAIFKSSSKKGVVPDLSRLEKAWSLLFSQCPPQKAIF